MGGAGKRCANANIVPSVPGDFVWRHTRICPLLENMAWFPGSRLRSPVPWEKAEINGIQEGWNVRKRIGPIPGDCWNSPGPRRRYPWVT